MGVHAASQSLVIWHRPSTAYHMHSGTRKLGQAVNWTQSLQSAACT